MAARVPATVPLMPSPASNRVPLTPCCSITASRGIAQVAEIVQADEPVQGADDDRLGGIVHGACSWAKTGHYYSVRVHRSAIRNAAGRAAARAVGPQGPIMGRTTIRENPVPLSRSPTFGLCGLAGVLLLASAATAGGEEVGKSIFLVTEDRRVTAVNAETGQFFDLDMSAKEVVEQRVVAKGVAIVITNQRFAGVGVWPTGWSSNRRMAGEKVVSTEAEDTSAVIVTTSRVLSFNGRTGSWAEKRR